MTEETNQKSSLTQPKYFYHYIPKIAENITTNQKPKDFKVIGILDSSGSMSNHWKMLAEEYNNLVDEVGPEFFYTITFDTKDRFRVIEGVHDPKLQPYIYKHGGGGTSINTGFIFFENTILPKIAADVELKVIFISDGQDNRLDTLQTRLDQLCGAQGRDISFMCLGVLSGFPTFISMQLRQKYHTSDPTVPSVFLIEYSGQKAFFNKFQSLREYIKTKEPIKISPSQLVFPWEGMQDVAKEGQWIFSEDKEISCNDGQVKLVYKNFNVEAVCDIFRSWTQKLQLDCLNRVNTHELTMEFAQITIKLMNDIVADVKASEDIDL